MSHQDIVAQAVAALGSQTLLAEALTEHGAATTQEAVSQWLSGKRKVSTLRQRAIEAVTRRSVVFQGTPRRRWTPGGS